MLRTLYPACVGKGPIVKGGEAARVAGAAGRFVGGRVHDESILLVYYTLTNNKYRVLLYIVP